MNVSDFITSLTRASHPRFKKKQVRALLERFIEIVRALPVGESLVINGFGTFRKMRTAPRVIYTPDGFHEGSLKQHEIPAMEVLKFRAYPSTKKRLARDAPKDAPKKRSSLDSGRRKAFSDENSDD